MKEEIRILNRTIRWSSSGLSYEPDQRHAEIIVEHLGAAGSKGAPTPSIQKAIKEDERGESKIMSGEEATQYRALVARSNYVAQDRIDLPYATKSLAQHMAGPKQCDWIPVKRLGKYLSNHTRLVQSFEWQEFPKAVTTFTDSDWASECTNRKSTSGGVVTLGAHTVKAWSSTQQVVALSSGEAELYALIRGAAQTKGIMACLCDFGIKADGVIKTDSTAALGITHRRGLGKTRHIEVQFLWNISFGSDSGVRLFSLSCLNTSYIGIISTQANNCL